jgi:DNA-binding transcriptional regulator YiaG
MSSLQQRLVAVSDMRLAAIAAAAANLKIQLSELERLREQVCLSEIKFAHTDDEVRQEMA